jgi:hypothetical protein
MRGLFNIVMQIFSSLLSLLAIAMGSVWVMQGLNVGPKAILRGFMVSDIRWTIYGAILALLGLAHLIWTNTRHKA